MAPWLAPVATERPHRRAVGSHIELAQNFGQSAASASAFIDAQLRAFAVTNVWSGTFYLLMTLAWHRALTSMAPTYRMGTLTIGAMTVGFVAASTIMAWQIWATPEAAPNSLSSLILAGVSGIGFISVIVWVPIASDQARRAEGGL